VRSSRWTVKPVLDAEIFAYVNVVSTGGRYAPVNPTSMPSATVTSGWYCQPTSWPAPSASS